MDAKSVDDRIAEERHKALAYSSYTTGNMPAQKAKQASPFIRFSYMPKRMIVVIVLIGLLLVGGVAGAVMKLSHSSNNGNTAKETSKSEESQDNGGDIVGYDGEESTGEENTQSSDKNEKKSSGNIVTDTFTSLGLVKETKPSSGSKPPKSSGGSSSSGSGSSQPKITKLIVFVEEAHSFSQMQKGMPYAFSLAQKYGYANNYSAIRHPSLPNHVAIITGSTHKITNDKAPSANAFAGTSVFGKAIAAGKTAKVYAEKQPGKCVQKSSGTYVVNHNPWAYVSSERKLCNKYNTDVAAFNADVDSGNLPTISMVIPNTCNSGATCSLTQADNWFKTRMQRIAAGADWKSGKLAVVLTSAEDGKAGNNKVLTAVMHPSLKGGAKSCTLNHYSLSRLFSEVTHTTPLGSAASASSIKSCFGLPI